MQQRQLRLGDILDDYCTRERRLTNHAVVAMVGDTVKQTRCTTCDTEHEYKHAKVPPQRRKNDTPPALYAQVAAGAPKRIAHEHPNGDEDPSDVMADDPVDDAAGDPESALSAAAPTDRNNPTAESQAAEPDVIGEDDDEPSGNESE